MAGLKDQLTRIEYIQGVTIFKEGDEVNNAYLIESGEVEIFRNENGKQVTLAVLGPGEILGEMGVISGNKRCASAVALEKTYLVKVDKEIIQDQISESNTIVKAILQSTAKRLEKTNADVHT